MVTMAYAGQTDHITYTSNCYNTGVKKKAAWYKLSTTQLSQSLRLHEDHNVLHLDRSDKITILLRFKNWSAVYRKKDGAVAILQNVTFKSASPQVLIEISNREEFVHKVRMRLMYAVALRNWTDDPAIKFLKDEVVLILADIQQSEFIGLTEEKQVGVFPSSTVKIITKPRRLLMDGLMMKVECSQDVVEICKTPGNLFKWETTNGAIVPLQQYSESGLKEMSLYGLTGFGNSPGDRTYEVIPPEEDVPRNTLTQLIAPLPTRTSLLHPYSRSLRQMAVEEKTVLKSETHEKEIPRREVFPTNIDTQLRAQSHTHPPPPLPRSRNLQMVVEEKTVFKSETPEKNIRPPPPKPRLPTKPPQLPSNYQNDRTPMQRFHLLRKTLEMTDQSPILSSKPCAVTPEQNDTEPKMPSDLSADVKSTSNLTAEITSQENPQTEHWFKGRMSRGAAEQLLTHEGDYLFRYKGGRSNAIVMSTRTEGNRFQHWIIINEDPYEQLLYDGTPDVEERILQFARSEELPFQDNRPIRLGGATQEEERIYGDYDTLPRETKSLWKRNQFKSSEISVGDDDGYYLMDEMTDMNDLEYIQHLIVKGEGNEDTLKYLIEKGDMEVSEDLQAAVAEHLIEKKWEEFGKLLKVPHNSRRRIEQEVSDISERTTALLDAWQKKRRNGATVKGLVSALLKLELEEISSLLEDLRDTLKVEDSA